MTVKYAMLVSGQLAIGNEDENGNLKDAFQIAVMPVNPNSPTEFTVMVIPFFHPINATETPTISKSHIVASVVADQKAASAYSERVSGIVRPTLEDISRLDEN